MSMCVYNRKKDIIHTAGIINTKKIPLDAEVDNKSLAYVIKSENRYAKAYANYVLGRVMRCENIRELDNYDIAITSECMLYQGYVVRHINPRNYKNPYIGQEAYRTQIINVKKELEDRSNDRSQIRDTIKLYSSVLDSERKFDFSLCKLYMSAPNKLVELKEELIKEKVEYEKADNDPTLIQLKIDLGEKEEQKEKLNKEKEVLTKENARLTNKLEVLKYNVTDKSEQLSQSTENLEKKMDTDGLAYQDAYNKYLANYIDYFSSNLLMRPK